MQKWIEQHLKQDKLLHFFFGFFIFLVASLFMDDTKALLLTFFIAFVKEVFYDLGVKKEGIEISDIVFTILPAILITLKNIL